MAHISSKLDEAALSHAKQVDAEQQLKQNLRRCSFNSFSNEKKR
ncbi:hypothetical protein [Paenibacillus puerhi]|nr:hypothetical protein [Paenibacillus puerhi]